MLAKPSTRKSSGTHYTPPELARAIAERLASLPGWPTEGPVTVLDPACGDGELLVAICKAIHPSCHRRVTLRGVDTDPASVEVARTRLAQLDVASVELRCADFLSDLWPVLPTIEEFTTAAALPRPSTQSADVVIANPPYVRTQVLGARRSQDLSSRFGLTGRADLYQAFLVAISRSLRAGGLVGILASNRYLSTLSGESTRELLAREFFIRELWDLGDTGLFDAAVLPAVLFAQKKSPSAQGISRVWKPRFVRVYSATPDGHHRLQDTSEFGSIAAVLGSDRSGQVAVKGRVFEVHADRFSLPNDPAANWTLNTRDELEWLERIRTHTGCEVGDIANVRVGVKTTADNVFIRADWDELPPSQRPEAELIHPILSKADARRWRPARAQPDASVLYTHIVLNGNREVIPLDKYPKARAYLESHRERLESRQYLRAAGRHWFEIWVPQDPGAWKLPKIVFQDISPDPIFYLDCTGSIVDGNCYWITLKPGVPLDFLYVILGCANSRVLARFHDLKFQNRLYSGRRRHLTQYVARYPIPTLPKPVMAQLVEAVRELCTGRPSEELEGRIESRIDGIVSSAFGV